MVVTLAVAIVVFWLGYDGGSYSLTSRATAAIGIAWAVMVGIAAGLLPASLRWRSALVPAAFLGLFALWSAASTGWAASAEDAFVEFDRVTLYLAVFVLAALGASRLTAPRIADGLALGISAVGFVALLARLFPGFVSQADLQTLLPAAFTRLSYPVNYWNGLGILLALAFPLLLRIAVAERPWLVRGAALVPLPALAATIYLTSSRGAFAVLALAVVSFLLLARERWSVVEAGAVVVLGSLLAILVLHARPSVVNPPLKGSAPSGPGQTAFVLIALLCVACGAVYAARLRSLPPLRIAPVAGRAAGIVVVAALVLAVLVSHPVRHFNAFKAPPVPPKPGQTDYVQSHLFSSNGSGRWQFYAAAAHEFEKRPIGGKGAGSFEAWWAQHGSLAVFVRDAHSLYLETLGELGLVGFVLLAAALLFPIALGVSALRRAPPEAQTTHAALFATALGFLLALAVDWMWELTVVSIVGFAVLGLLAGLGGTEPRRPPSRSRVPRVAATVVAAVIGLALIAGQAIALLSETRLDASQAAVRRGDTAAAISNARAARDVEPWGASPYLQLALIQEAAGRLSSAEDQIRRAIHRDETDWRLWLTQARIQTKRGEIRAARRSLKRARELNPRSPIFTRP
jgi:O-Antigen ligase